MGKYGIEDYLDDMEDFEPILDDVCPNCHTEYDEIDYEYQICHYCNFENKNYLKK